MIGFFVLLGIFLLIFANTTFGLLGDIVFGLIFTIVVGAYLDHRKHNWKGRKTP
jgi:uncharacterized RDD family membrane protein YckC